MLSLSIRRKFLWSAATRLAFGKKILETSRLINLGQVFILIWNPPKAPMEKCIGRYSISNRVKKSGFSGQVHLSRTIFGRFARSQPSARWTSLLDIHIFSRRRGKINITKDLILTISDHDLPFADWLTQTMTFLRFDWWYNSDWGELLNDSWWSYRGTSRNF